MSATFAYCPGADYLLQEPQRDITNTIDLAPYAVVGGLDRVCMIIDHEARSNQPIK